MKNDDEKTRILLETGTNEVEFLRFAVCDEHYGINVAKISQIVMFQEEMLTRLPFMDHGVIGSMPFRGLSIVVIDLAEHLKLKVDPAKVPADQVLLITEFNRTFVAYRIDKVDSIYRCSWTDFDPLSGHACFEKAASVVGTVKINDEIVLILDIEALLGEVIPSAAIETYSGLVESVSASKAAEEPHIMICEDSSIIRRLIKGTLNGAGYKNLTVFETGLDAYEYFKDPEKKAVDVLISDIEMPSMDGLTLCKKIRDELRVLELPVYFFSSMINDQMKRKCESVGASGVYSKPEINNLVAEINHFVEDHWKASES